MSSARFLFLGGVLLGFLAGLVGYRSLANGFVNFDDPEMVQENPLLDHPGWEEVWRAATEVRNDARLPVYTLAYFPEAVLAGKDPAAFHLASLLWHWGDALLILLFVWLLSRNRFLALITASLFVVHPVAMESVAWISGRKEQVSLFFLLAGLLWHLRWLERGGVARYLLAALLFLMGTFAKASVVVFPALALAVLFFCLGRGRVKPGLHLVRGALGLFLLAVFPALVHLLQARASGVGGAAASHGTWAGFLLFLSACPRYLWHLLAPLKLSIHQYLPATGGLFSGGRLAGGALVMALVGGSLCFFRGRRGWVTFCCTWILVALLPFNNMFPKTSVPLADRYLSAALPGALLLLALLFSLLRPAVVRLCLVSLLVGGLALLSMQLVPTFKNTESLFRAARERDPLDPLPPLKLGEVAMSRGRLPEAVELFNQAVGLAGDAVGEVRARLKLADALLKGARFKQALAEFLRVEHLADQDPERFLKLQLDRKLLDYQRVQCLFGLERRVEGRHVLEGLLKQHPHYSWGLLMKGRLEVANGIDILGETGNQENKSLARKLVDEGLAILTRLRRGLQNEKQPEDPRQAALRLKLLKAVEETLGKSWLQARWRSSWRTHAMLHGDALAALDPSDPEGCLLKARVYQATGQLAKVRQNLLLARARAPSSVRVGLRLAHHYRATHENRKARRLLLKLLSKAPDNRGVRVELSDLYGAQARRRLEEGDPDRARKAALEALRLTPERNASNLVLGEVLRAQGRWEAAARTYRAVLKRKPREKEARLGLALYYQALGLGTQARMERSLKGLLGKRRMEAAKKIEEEILGAYRKALDLGGDAVQLAIARRFLNAKRRKRQAQVARALVQKSQEAWKRGEHEQAIRLLRDAIGVNGTDKELWLRLAGLENHEKHWKEALEAVHKALSLDQENLQALMLAARLDFIQGDSRQAAIMGRRFLKAASHYQPSPLLADLVKQVRKLVREAEGASSGRRRGGR